jgi:hypothetical protein
MKAFEIKEHLIELLASSACGRYNTLGTTNRKTDAEDVSITPQITVVYAQGNFDKSSSSVNGPYQHEVTLEIRVLCGATSRANLDILKNPAATPEEIAAALADKSNAVADADKLADETISLLFDIIMRPRNRDLGAGENADRWIESIKKFDAVDKGDIVLVPAILTLTFHATEYTTEEEGSPGEEILHGASVSTDPVEIPEEQGVMIAAPKP